jgi:hypothetical protein
MLADHTAVTDAWYTHRWLPCFLFLAGLSLPAQAAQGAYWHGRSRDVKETGKHINIEPSDQESVRKPRLRGGL